MKIICIGRNYAEHAKELNNAVPSEPVIFLKPETALLKHNDAFIYPSFSNNIHHEIEVVLKINQSGKNIPQASAHLFYDEITVGIDFTARDIQDQCKQKGLPWEKAKAFDGAAAIGQFVLKNTVQTIDFCLAINGTLVQIGNTKDMIYSCDFLIAYVSRYFTLEKGDLIFTGTPKGVGPVHQKDCLEGYLNDEKLLTVHIE